MFSEPNPSSLASATPDEILFNRILSSKNPIVAEDILMLRDLNLVGAPCPCHPHEYPTTDKQTCPNRRGVISRASLSRAFLSENMSQLQNEVCLRYPEPLVPHASFSFESAIAFLVKAVMLASQQPFAWLPIDRPQEGHVYLCFLAQQHSGFPNDGVRYMDQEVRYEIPAGPRLLEVHEVKYGFIPNSGDVQACRLRRRYRLLKGGHPGLMLVHYSTGPAQPINPAIAKEPCRSYPIPNVDTGRYFVLGERAGQRVGGAGQVPPGVGVGEGMVMPMRNVDKLAQHANQLEALNARQLPERPPVSQDDYDEEESGLISSRSLAVMRYRRNHELMNDVFWRASDGSNKAVERENPYKNFDTVEMESKIGTLTEEIEQLKSRQPKRRGMSEIQV